MKLRRAFALLLTASLFVPLARLAAAQDAAAPAAAAPKADAPPKKAASKRKRKVIKRKKKPAVESKYKSRALAESVVEQYRFDRNGNPIGAKKKPAAKAKKKASSDSLDGLDDDKPACTDDAPCSDKKSSDADAL